MDVLPGKPFPLGVSLSEDGINVAVASSTAEHVWVCLIDESGNETRHALPQNDAGIWHGFLPGVTAGQRYGLRASGPYDPSRGLRFNDAKLLLDPYARATVGELRYGPSIYGHDLDEPSRPSSLDSAKDVPLGIVIDDAFDWTGDTSPNRRYADTVVYEVHVKGFTQLHPGVPADMRGTYAGLAHPAAVQHLVDLGVTAIELLPVHQSVTEPSVHSHGLANYWGYNTLGFFAPHAAYSAEAKRGVVGGQVREFKAMVKALHAAGLEVILDVVYNHTCEGGAGGPTLCFRGLDNPDYYRLDPHDPAGYYDTTGTGNSIDAGSTTALWLIMDSLRYWVEEMHVDGFRFDLAATLSREDGAFDRTASFFDLIAQDPVVNRVKLIAEPWDVGQMDSYDIGRFPAMWREWNGAYRDTVRDFWRSKPSLMSTLASRITGSSDLYGNSARRPTASVNFVTAHDGFTLRDLVSYDSKHNEANLEDNRDGTSDNRSWNCGAEGPTDDPTVNALRSRQQRALLTTLLTSFGIPMLLGGDELGRTQQGNNNAYCQDGTVAWFDWSAPDQALLAFTRRLVRMRLEHPVFRRRRFLVGSQTDEIQWYTPAGALMNDGDWNDPNARCIVLYLDGNDLPDTGADGSPLLDDDFLVMVNAWWEPLGMVIPPVDGAREWQREIDTDDDAVGASADPPNPGAPMAIGSTVTVAARSMLILRGRRGL
ncbi:MAG: glycogen debranching protein GlgX [Actinomycetes bacterium]